jgi:hypothetical protein
MYYFDECYLAIVMLNSDGDYDVVQEYGFADGPGITQVTDQQDPSTIQLPFTPGLSGLEACSPACGGWGEWLELWNAPGNDPAAASLLGISNEITL